MRKVWISLGVMGLLSTHAAWAYQTQRWVDVLAGGAIGYGAARFWSEPVQGGRLSVLPARGGLAVGWARAF